MSLTPAELAAARAFRVAQRALLDGSGPADITADVHVRYVRHDCAAKGGKSVSLELREHYVWSPRYLVIGGEAVETVAGNEYVPALAAEISARRFGWIFTAGKCAACGMTARSGAGRLVDPAERPPSDRAIVG